MAPGLAALTALCTLKHHLPCMATCTLLASQYRKTTLVNYKIAFKYTVQLKTNNNNNNKSGQLYIRATGAVQKRAGPIHLGSVWLTQDIHVAFQGVRDGESLILPCTWKCCCHTSLILLHCFSEVILVSELTLGSLHPLSFWLQTCSYSWSTSCPINMSLIHKEFPPLPSINKDNKIQLKLNKCVESFYATTLAAQLH